MESENAVHFSVESAIKSVVERNEHDFLNSVSFNSHFRCRRSFKFRNLSHSKYLRDIYPFHTKYRDLHTENSFSSAWELICETCHIRLGSLMQLNTAKVDTSTQTFAPFSFILHNFIVSWGWWKKLHKSPVSISLSILNSYVLNPPPSPADVRIFHSSRPTSLFTGMFAW
jgi:hypothetical protein